MTGAMVSTLQRWKSGWRRTRLEIKAVCMVHNETSTGVASRVVRCARRSIERSILRCLWWIRFRRWVRLITGMMNGKSM